MVVLEALDWPAASIDQLLAGHDPDATPLGEPDPPAFETDYNSRIAQMPDHVCRMIDDLIDGFEHRDRED